MLKKINEGGVKSDDNSFSMQIVHPEYLEYKEDDRCIPISIAYDPKSQKVYIYVSDIKELNEIEKKRVLNNIREAVKLLGGNYEVI